MCITHTLSLMKDTTIQRILNIALWYDALMAHDSEEYTTIYDQITGPVSS